MSRLIQIVYISRSSFITATNSTEIEPNVARILAKSRVNNRKNGLVGVLYFGDGCFFQCLEGEDTQVDKLYSKLQQDPRHKDLKLISRKLINTLTFSNWAMKFVPLETKLNAELQAHGYTSFDPYKFDAAMTEKVLNLLQISTSVDSQNTDLQHLDKSSGIKPKNNLALFAIILSIISLTLSIYNLFH